MTNPWISHPTRTLAPIITNVDSQSTGGIDSTSAVYSQVDHTPLSDYRFDNPNVTGFLSSSNPSGSEITGAGIPLPSSVDTLDITTGSSNTAPSIKVESPTTISSNTAPSINVESPTTINNNTGSSV